MLLAEFKQQNGPPVIHNTSEPTDRSLAAKTYGLFNLRLVSPTRQLTLVYQPYFIFAIAWPNCLSIDPRSYTSTRFPSKGYQEVA